MMDFSKYHGPMKIIFREAELLDESVDSVDITFDNSVGIITLRFSRNDYNLLRDALALQL